MSSTGAEATTIFGRLPGVRHAFRIHPRGTLISSERLGFLSLPPHFQVAGRGGTVHYCWTLTNKGQQ